MNKISYISLVAGVLMLNGCYEDKGHYDYTPTNGITFEVNPQNKTYYLGERYFYSPKVIYEQEGDSVNYSYWWEIMNKKEGVAAVDTACVGFDLDFYPNAEKSVGVRMCAMDLRTKVVHSSDEVTLTGQAALSQGWLILSEKSGESALSYIRPEMTDDKKRFYTEYPDLYKTLYPNESLGSGPKRLRQIIHNNSTVVVVIQESGALYLNGSSYIKEMTVAQDFVGDVPVGLNVKDFFWGNGVDFLLDENGNLYSRDYFDDGREVDLFTTPFTGVRMQLEGERLNIRDIIFTGRPTAAFFNAFNDAENRRLLWFGSGYNTSAIKKFYPIRMLDVDTLINLNDYGDWDLLYMRSGQEASWSDIPTFALFRKGDVVKSLNMRVAYFVPTVNPPFSAIAMSSCDQSNFDGTKYLSEDSKFYRLRQRAYFFFSSGNTIYWYDLSTKKAYKFDEVEGGDVIVDIETNSSETELGVVTANGIFATFTIKNEHLFDPKHLIYQKDGFGRIVDLEFKWSNWNKYNMPKTDE